MQRSIALAILVTAAFSATAEAQEARVKVVYNSQTIGMFERVVTVQGAAADRLANPTAADLKPYLVATQKALAEREGYTEQLYGANHYALAEGRLVETSVIDPSGRTLYTSRDPLENRARETQMVKQMRTFENEAQPDDVVGLAPPTHHRNAAVSPVRSFPFIRRSSAE